MRVQFFPSLVLKNKLTVEAAKKGMRISEFVVDLLEDYYGLKPKMSLSQLKQTVFSEIEAYINTEEFFSFDLFTASETFRNISMIVAETHKPQTIRASIGKAFASCVGKEGPFIDIEPYIVNGKQKLSVGNRSMLYVKKRQ